MAKYAPKWREADYTDFFLLDEPIHTEKEILQEYSRYRNILLKRAGRLSEAGLTAQAEYLRGMVPKISSLDSTEVAQRLSRAHAIAGERSYSLSGIKQIQKMYQDEGAGIKLGEVLGFHQYMQSWRTSAFSGIVAASDAANAYDDYQDYGGSFADFWTIYKGIQA